MERKEVSYEEYANEIVEMNKKLEEKYGWKQARRTEIQDMSFYNSRNGKVGINWSAIGTVDCEEAQAFAEQLMEATKIAESFKYNGYAIVY